MPIEMILLVGALVLFIAKDQKAKAAAAAAEWESLLSRAAACHPKNRKKKCTCKTK
jgi:hypothetical protein